MQFFRHFPLLQLHHQRGLPEQQQAHDGAVRADGRHRPHGDRAR